MSEKKMYKDVFYKRWWSVVVSFLRSIPQSKANAIYVAVGFFVVLIAFLEYKVFESTYNATGDLVLSMSVMTVTAFGGVLAETVLHRNTKGTDDQRAAASTLFYISLVASAVAGFGVWAQSTGADAIHIAGSTFSLPDFAEFVFAMITIVTVADILLLRWYIREDVDAKHARNKERINSRKREAELATDESLIEFEAEVERKVAKTLKIESKRKEMVDSLKRMYGGKVPPEVLADAMKSLDSIQKADALADDDGDGTANSDDSTYNMRPVYTKTVSSPKGEAVSKQNFTKGQK